MKKVIFGTGLLICGVLGFMTTILREAIFFASPNTIVSLGGVDGIAVLSAVSFFAGIVFIILGFLENDSRHGNHRNPEENDSSNTEDDYSISKKECPSCGKKHDIDFPKCPYCKHNYSSG